MFSIQERDALRNRLIAAARGDDRVTAAAIVGSGARDAEDAWSDIDLALRLGAGLEPGGVADEWSARMYEGAGAVDHLDVWAGTTLFRVFLLSGTLQVDLSFWASDAFAPSGGSFRLLFGEANEPRALRSPVVEDPIGIGWLHALHARSSIARGRMQQALQMIDVVRAQGIALARARHRLPAEQDGGVDDLPAELRARIAEALVAGLGESELHRALAMSVGILLDETRRVDPDREQRIGEVVRELAGLAA